MTTNLTTAADRLIKLSEIFAKADTLMVEAFSLANPDDTTGPFYLRIKAAAERTTALKDRANEEIEKRSKRLAAEAKKSAAEDNSQASLEKQAKKLLDRAAKSGQTVEQLLKAIAESAKAESTPKAQTKAEIKAAKAAAKKSA